MPRPKLTLFLDPISPFAYMAFYVVRTSPAFKECDVELIPIFLGGVMQKTGNRPPLMIQNKGAYLMRDRVRWCKKFNIPMADGMPENFPQPTIQAGRALCFIQQKYPDKLSAAFVVLFDCLWRDLKPVGKPEVFSTYLAKVFTEDEVKTIVEATSSPAVKEQLVKNTDYALEQGCFGLPYYLATNSNGETDTFWGFDHLGQIVDHLGLARTGKEWQAML